MNITIFGASRGVGRAALDVAVARGHSIVAVARNASALRDTPARTVIGDALDDGVVRRALEGADAVLVALGTSRSDGGADAQRQICSRATRAILAAMQPLGVQRIVVVSSYGVGPTIAKRPFPFNLVAATLLKGVMADKELQEREVRESSTQWTIAQPLGLTDAPATGAPYVSTDGTRRLTRISRADVATVCIDAIEAQTFVRETIAISAAA